MAQKVKLNMESLLSILGSIASIGAAIWSFIEAKKSINAATKAELLRDELIHRRKTVEISQVYAETKRVLNVVSKVGPSCNIQLLKGINCADIAKEVEIFSSFILEQSGHFSEDFYNTAKVLSTDLKNDIESLAEASSFEDKKKFGKNIFYKIQTFTPIVKKLSDEKREYASKQ